MGLFSGFKKSSLFYHPGCYTYFKLKNTFELYLRIFDKLGINVILDENVCCGLPALELGYEAEARKLARKNFDLFKERGVSKIITNCSACHKMFSKDYQELLPDWNIEVENIWKLILDKLREKPRFIKNMINEEVGFHDSSYLGRYCGIYDEPRDILKLIGCKIKEIPESRENSYDVSSGNVEINNKELVDKIAKNRLLQFKRDRIKKVVVASPLDYMILKRNSYKHDVEIIEISELLGVALGVLKKVEDNEEIEADKILIREINEEERAREIKNE